jgi:excisionase family DNA binding protein
VTEPSGNGKELLRPEEVAEILDIGRTKLYAMIRQGELPALHVGRLVRIPRCQLDSWIQERVRARRAAPR